MTTCTVQTFDYLHCADISSQNQQPVQLQVTFCPHLQFYESSSVCDLSLALLHMAAINFLITIITPTDVTSELYVPNAQLLPQLKGNSIYRQCTELFQCNEVYKIVFWLGHAMWKAGSKSVIQIHPPFSEGWSWCCMTVMNKMWTDCVYNYDTTTSPFLEAFSTPEENNALVNSRY